MKTIGKVKIIPKNKRAQNRTREHGFEMNLVQEGNWGEDKAILVQSFKENWFGWFSAKEADWEFLS